MRYIKIVPYSKNLVQTLVKDITKEFRTNLDKVNVIFTHKRPIHFFHYYLSKEIPFPTFLGVVQSFEDWVDMLFFKTGGGYSSYLTLNDYDQAYVAYLCAMKVLPAKYRTNFGDFFPWAMEIASIFRELDLEMVVPEDILYPPEDKLDRVAQEILKRLADIYLEFNTYLDKNRYITHWKKLRFLADKDFEIGEGPYYFLGFFALTKAESKLLKKFYDHGARFYWHGGLECLHDVYREWLKDWAINNSEIIYEVESSKKRHIKILEAHDLHLELEELKKALKIKQDAESPDQIAIILPDPSILIPTIYALPKDVKINITMGYPFNLSGIFILIDLLFRLILKKNDTLGYTIKEFSRLLTGPYLRENKKLSFFLKILEEFSDPFITRDEINGLCEKVQDDLEVPPEEVSAEVNKLFEFVIGPIEKSRSLKELASAIWSVIDFVSHFESELAILEREFFAYLIDKCVPLLEDSLFSDVHMEGRQLYNFVNRVSSSLRIPFEGEPLSGLQVMGVLESRALSFKKVYVLDVNEGILPGISLPSPLLPLEVREALGFPTRSREEAIYEYHFQRLIKSSEEINLFYQHRTVSNGDIEGKRVRSRFIEKILWELEKDQKTITYETNPVVDKDFYLEFKSSCSDIIIPEKRSIELSKDSLLRERISTRIMQINPSILNEYLKCPKRFLFSNILDLSGRKEIEEVRLDKLGEVIHLSLYKYFSKISTNNGCINKRELRFEILEKYFLESFEANRLLKKISNSKKHMLIYFTKFRLKQFLTNFPEQTNIIDMERNVTVPFQFHGKDITLQGRIDRIDLRGDIFYILDYKTGRIPLFANIFKDFDVPTAYEHEGISQVYEFIKDIQIPFYIYLYGMNNKICFSKIRGGIVDLSFDGKEKIWMDIRNKREIQERYKDFFEHTFPQILTYLIEHMIYGQVSGPVEPTTCKYCEYKPCCTSCI